MFQQFVFAGLRTIEPSIRSNLAGVALLDFRSKECVECVTWGEIFSLFPSTCTDTFGPKFATVNLSLLYTAKGTSAFLVPVANLIKSSTGSWHMVFVVTALIASRCLLYT